MKSKEVVIMFLVITLLLGSNLFYSLYENTLKIEYEVENYNDSELISLYIDYNGEGNYEKYDAETSSIILNYFTLNTDNSSCENGSSISSENEVISIKISGSDSCDLYFDKVNAKLSELIFKGEFDNCDADLYACNSTSGIEEYIISKSAVNLDEIETEDKGLYATEDNDGTSYYFRGAVEDNFVLFADMLWRIIRIDGNGNIRLMLYNEDPTGTEYYGMNSNSKYSYADFDSFDYDNVFEHEIFECGIISEDEKDDSYIELCDIGYTKNYVFDYEYNGYYYDDIYNESEYIITLKSVIDTWYDDNLESFSSFISSETKFCNSIYTTGDIIESLMCDSTEELENSNIALISLEEVIFAGAALEDTNNQFYLYSTSAYHTLTFYDGFMHYTDFTIGNYMLYFVSGTEEASVFPVIGLNGNVESSQGNGTLENPYVIAETLT